MSTNAIHIRDLVAVREDETDPTQENGASISAATIAYWATMAGIYLAFGFLWYFASKEKLIDDGFAMPGGLKKAYAGTFVESFPGLNLTWALLGIVEAIAFLGVVASLLTGEFLPSRRKPILTGALGVSLFAFSLLVFGQELIGENEGVAEMFGYIAATGVTLLLVQMLPPRRGLWKLTK